jgi:hypothetical protein
VKIEWRTESRDWEPVPAEHSMPKSKLAGVLRCVGVSNQDARNGRCA